MTLTSSCEYYQQFIVGPGRVASANFREWWLPSVTCVSKRAETILWSNTFSLESFTYFFVSDIATTPASHPYFHLDLRRLDDCWQEMSMDESCSSARVAFVFLLLLFLSPRASSNMHWSKQLPNTRSKCQDKTGEENIEIKSIQF